MKKKEYREKLAAEFAELLEEKQLEWKKEWRGRNVPLNAKTGKAYKGSNRFYLSLIAAERGYNDPRWATFHQIQTEGWRLKNAKGKGVSIEYWYPYDTVDKKSLSWTEFYDLRETIGERYQLRTKYFTVFNAVLIEGITPYESKAEEIAVDDLVDKLSLSMGVEILNDGGDRAYYRPSEDRIHLPTPDSFYSTYAYNSTALHELTHATGAESRLNRNLSGMYGSPEYAFEELVAEISSCFMSAHLQIEQDQQHIENHKAYVQNWVSAIREQPEVLFRAIQQAEKATTYMEYKAELISKERYTEIQQSAPKANESILEGPRDFTQNIMLQTDEKVYYLDSEIYLHIQTSDEGYDYTFFDRHFQLVDGGRLDRTDLSLEAARDEIMQFHDVSPNSVSEIMLDEYERIQELVDQEPVVTISFTESNRFEERKKLPFSEADSLFEEVDRETREAYGEKGYYDKTYFTIEYMESGRLRTYEGRQDMGNLEGSLTAHILNHATYYRNDPVYQANLASQGGDSQEKANAIYDHTIHVLVPFLKMHKNLSEIEKNTLEAEQTILLESAEIGNLEKRNLDYYDAMLVYVRNCRLELNSAEVPKLPDAPKLEDYMENLEEYKKHVRQEIEEEAENYGMTLENYAANGYEPYASVEEDLSEAQTTIYYPINEDGARRAQEMNSFSEYQNGSATEEYRRAVDRAVEIAELQKNEIDPMYHDRVDRLVNAYARRLAQNMNERFEIDARVPSVLIAGAANFPTKKKEKQNNARDRNMKEWKEIQGILEQIKSTGKGGISSDDPDAVEKLEKKLEHLQKNQEKMKSVNRYYRKYSTLEGCPDLTREERNELQGWMLAGQRNPYERYTLTNNNAEIRRIKKRIETIKQNQEADYPGWKFEGGKVLAKKETNRLQIIFEEKPDEDMRSELKRQGFRWSPREQAWQRQLNRNAYYAAKQIDSIQPTVGSPLEKSVEVLIKKTREGLQQLQTDNNLLSDVVVIQEYEKSIGRAESVISRYSEEEELRKYADQCREYLEFGREVDQCLAGELQKRNAVKVCETPELILQAGLTSLPMHMTQRHLRDCMREKDIGQPHYHGLKREEIKRIPEELKKPAAILQSPTRKDSIVVILGYRETDNLPVLVSIVPDGTATYNLEHVESNFITSIYGKDNIQEYIGRSMEKGQLIYINKEKSKELALLPLQLRQDHLAPAFDCIIKRINCDVKTDIAPAVDIKTISEVKSEKKMKKEISEGKTSQKEMMPRL